jgi:hydroxyethylthiazole kinase-like uncharacterized protein yjeF
VRRAWSVADTRAVEAQAMAELPDGALMERAAAALSVACVDLLAGSYGAGVVLVVGGGDNGGDALLAGAALARRGARVDALPVSARVHEAGLRTFLAAGGHHHPDPTSPAAQRALTRAELVFEGVAGIGGSGPLRPDAAALFDAVGPDAVMVAVDVPTGVDSDTGEAPGASVRAHVTVTFGAAKPAHLIDPGAARCGQLVVADIGLVHGDRAPAVESLERDDVRALLRAPRTTDDKYSRGVVGVVAGSDRYTGAAVLTVSGALGAGAGMVRAVLPAPAAEQVRLAHPETLVTDLDPWQPSAVHDVGRVQSWVVGPGIGTDDAAAAVVRAVLAADVPVVLDADAVTVLSVDPTLLDGRRAPTVLTPHAGELARLLGVERGEIEGRRLAHVRAAADRFGATVLLKGSTTLVATAGHATVRANPRATAWLSTAGAGDVLAGVVAAQLAAGAGPHDAASIGAWVHAAAAADASADGPLLAGEVATALPTVVARLLGPPAAAGSTP